MLGLSNALNTSKIYSKKVKDITMNNEQVALYNQGHLRDYTGIGTLLLAFSQGCLRYSPLFCKDMKLGDKLPTRFIYVCKLPLPFFFIKKRGGMELSISRRLAGYPPTPTDTPHFCDNRGGEDKLDPN
jgi:hypothetical protein